MDGAGKRKPHEGLRGKGGIYKERGLRDIRKKTRQQQKERKQQARRSRRGKGEENEELC